MFIHIYVILWFVYPSAITKQFHNKINQNKQIKVHFLTTFLLQMLHYVMCIYNKYSIFFLPWNFLTFSSAWLLLVAAAAGEVVDILVLLHVTEDHGTDGSVHQVANVLHPGADLVRVMSFPINFARKLLETLFVANFLCPALCSVFILIWEVFVKELEYLA